MGHISLTAHSELTWRNNHRYSSASLRIIQLSSAQLSLALVNQNFIPLAAILGCAV